MPVPELSHRENPQPSELSFVFSQNRQVTFTPNNETFAATVFSRLNENCEWARRFSISPNFIIVVENAVETPFSSLSSQQAEATIKSMGERTIYLESGYFEGWPMPTRLIIQSQNDEFESLTVDPLRNRLH